MIPIAYTFPLPLYQMIRMGTMTGKTGDSFTMFVGLDRDRVADLKAKSLDESDIEIQKNTSDRERFGLGSYEEWYAKERVPFALVHDATGALAALVWFGPKPLGRKSLKHLSAEERLHEAESVKEAGDWHTIVYRAYPPFRGAGIMKKFTLACMDEYWKHVPTARLWAGIHAENPASEGLATALGFVVDEELSDRTAHHLVMVADHPQS